MVAADGRVETSPLRQGDAHTRNVSQNVQSHLYLSVRPSKFPPGPSSFLIILEARNPAKPAP